MEPACRALALVESAGTTFAGLREARCADPASPAPLAGRQEHHNDDLASCALLH